VRDKGFTYSVEVLVKARAKGLRIVEVPVSCIYYREHERNSTLHPVVHGVSVLLGTVRWRIWEFLRCRETRRTARNAVKGIDRAAKVW